MGKQSHRSRKKNSPPEMLETPPLKNAKPGFDILDVIPDFVSIYNYVIIEPEALAHINKLNPQARDAFVHRWVGDYAWNIAHAAHYAFMKANSDELSLDDTGDAIEAAVHSYLLAGCR